MDRAGFWKIIETSLKKSKGDADDQIDILHGELQGLSTKEIVSFADHFRDLWFAGYRWDLWGAAYLIGGGCSDDSFMDFRGWLIGRGQAAYEAALKNPDSLAMVVSDDEDGKIEGYQYIAQQVWEDKTGKDGLDFPGGEGVHPAEPVGTKWTDEDLPRLFPELWKRFSDNV
jgi:hypothetical protein